MNVDYGPHHVKEPSVSRRDAGRRDGVMNVNYESNHLEESGFHVNLVFNTCPPGLDAGCRDGVMNVDGSPFHGEEPSLHVKE
ncbi:hypothetical protein MAR_037703 [Mya arenaria]|uniref:Uncharacterized protein n=1 Tax=Mya arenaria TaxID=6604 RepID=A0ABY7FT42_MYAAR|nr:hypothetical protein MAR_037703 [Mya arenaria]